MGTALKRYSLRFGILLILLSFRCASAPCQHIIVTGDPNYAPLTWQRNDSKVRLKGFGVRMLEDAFKNQRVKITPSFEGNWSRALDSIKRGVTNMIIVPYKTLDRSKHLQFIEPPLALTQMTLFYRRQENAWNYQGLKDLFGKVGVGVRGHSGGDKFDAFEQEKMDVKKVSSIDQAVLMLAKNRVDYAVLDLVPALVQIDRLNLQTKLVYVHTPLNREGIYFAVSAKVDCPIWTATIKQYLENLTEAQKLTLIRDALLEWRQELAAGNKQHP